MNETWNAPVIHTLESLRNQLDTLIESMRGTLEALEAMGEKPMIELVDALERAGAEIPPMLRMLAASQ